MASPRKAKPWLHRRILLKLKAKLTSLPNTFTLFPSLPKDIQLKIWGLVEVEAAVVEIRMVKVFQGGITRPAPAVLHACRDARMEFLCKIQGSAKSHPVYELLHCIMKRHGH
jgi:hypothetical protein